MVKSLFWVKLLAAGKVVGEVGGVASCLGIILLSIAMSIDYALPNCTVHETYVLLSIALAYTVLFGISSLLLIMGIKKNCYQLLMPWLCLAGILLISIILCLFAGQLTVIEPYLPFIWLLTALLCYVYYGIFSLYKRIKAIHHERLLQQEFENVKQTMNRMHGLYYNRP